MVLAGWRAPRSNMPVSPGAITIGLGGIASLLILFRLIFTPDGGGDVSDFAPPGVDVDVDLSRRSGCSSGCWPRRGSPSAAGSPMQEEGSSFGDIGGGCGPAAAPPPPRAPAGQAAGDAPPPPPAAGAGHRLRRPRREGRSLRHPPPPTEQRSVAPARPRNVVETGADWGTSARLQPSDDGHLASIASPAIAWRRHSVAGAIVRLLTWLGWSRSPPRDRTPIGRLRRGPCARHRRAIRAIVLRVRAESAIALPVSALVAIAYRRGRIALAAHCRHLGRDRRRRSFLRLPDRLDTIPTLSGDRFALDIAAVRRSGSRPTVAAGVVSSAWPRPSAITPGG